MIHLHISVNHIFRPSGILHDSYFTLNALERTMNRWSAHVIAIVRCDDVTFLDELEKTDGRNV